MKLIFFIEVITKYKQFIGLQSFATHAFNGKAPCTHRFALELPEQTT